jgi:hypothetical protein
MKEQQLTEPQQIEARGFGAGHIVLAVLGGAAAGAAVAFFTSPRSGPDNRRRVRDLAGDTRETAGRLPLALKEATKAAQTAFSGAMTAETNSSP